MKTIQLSGASRPLAEYARELKGEILVLKDADELVAAIVPFLGLIARSRAQFAAGQTLSLEEMKRAVLPGGKANKAVHRTRRKTARR